MTFRASSASVLAKATSSVVLGVDGDGAVGVDVDVMVKSFGWSCGDRRESVCV